MTLKQNEQEDLGVDLTKSIEKKKKKGSGAGWRRGNWKEN